jgi:hypothetical protein
MTIEVLTDGIKSTCANTVNKINKLVTVFAARSLTNCTVITNRDRTRDSRKCILTGEFRLRYNQCTATLI